MILPTTRQPGSNLGDEARCRGDNLGTNFGRGAPNKICEGKKRTKFGAISDNFRLWAQITPEQIDITEISIASDKYNPSHVGG